jgi:hypothetical protein
MIPFANYQSETDKATQIMRLQRTVEFLTTQRDIYKTALKLIGNLPYQEREREDNTWDKISFKEAEDYLHMAVDCALDALWKG